jgi:succinate dehydrogenase flavin-adding protein (antitoxin of CptAB toxin-antitoxin module)
MNTKYSLDTIFEYSGDELDNFIKQFTTNQFNSMNEKRFMTVRYLQENNLLDEEMVSLLTNNRENFLEALKRYNTLQEVRNNVSNYTKVEMDYEYVIVNTGYTSRITSGNDEKSNFWESLNPDPDPQNNPDIELLFVYDNTWGTGLYKEGKNNQEVDKLIRISRELNLYIDGIACFKCSQKYFKDLSEVINESTYCVIFGITETCFYKSNNKQDSNILYVAWDSESG